MRYICDVPEAPELAECFVELDDRWSRKEVRDFWSFYYADDDKDYLALVIKKLRACRIDAPGREPITDAGELTVKMLRDDIDERLANWVILVPVKHINALGELKKTFSKRLFASTAENSATESADPPS